MIEDLEDTVDKCETVEEAYTPILKNMINIARLEKKCRRVRDLGFEQKKFKSAVIKHYGARNKENGTRRKRCLAVSLNLGLARSPEPVAA